MEMYVAHPLLALATAALFMVLWTMSRRRLAASAGIAWLVYGVYEYLMQARVLCGGDCNIRVDLLAIYPALLLLSVVAALKSFKPRARQDGAG